MTSYLDQFQQMTESFMQVDEDEASIAQLSIEVWSSLFEQELAEN